MGKPLPLPFTCVCVSVRQIGDEGLQSHVRDQLSVHLQSVHQRLAMLESQLVVAEPRRESIVAQMDRLERQLLDLHASGPHHHRTPGDVLPAGTTSGAATAVDAAGLDEVTTELDVVEKVLHVLSMEANKMLDQMKTAENTQQQHNSMLDSLHARVSRVQSLQPRTAMIKVRGKGFPYSIPSVGPGADPGVQAVSPQVTVSHPPGSRLPLLSARPAVTSPASEHHRPLAGTKLYCLVTEAHRCEQLAQGCYAASPRA